MALKTGNLTVTIIPASIGLGVSSYLELGIWDLFSYFLSLTYIIHIE